jgi:uncharacterized membrane protein
MSADLHEMHALLQQLKDIHQSHDLDHCEFSLKAAGKAIIAKAKAAAAEANPVAAAAAALAAAVAKGAVDAHKQHDEDVKTKKHKKKK